MSFRRKYNVTNEEIDKIAERYASKFIGMIKLHGAGKIAGKLDWCAGLDPWDEEDVLDLAYNFKVSGGAIAETLAEIRGEVEKDAPV